MAHDQILQHPAHAGLTEFPGRDKVIDVKELIKKYTVAELNESAEIYWQSMDIHAISQKPFRFPDCLSGESLNSMNRV